MENNIENDSVSYKRGLQQRMVTLHKSNTRCMPADLSPFTKKKLLMHEGNKVFSGSLYCLVNLAPEQQTSTSLRVESWQMKESFFSF